jgi:hypothetical protein
MTSLKAKALTLFNNSVSVGGNLSNWMMTELLRWPRVTGRGQADAVGANTVVGRVLDGGGRRNRANGCYQKRMQCNWYCDYH